MNLKDLGSKLEISVLIFVISHLKHQKLAPPVKASNHGSLVSGLFFVEMGSLSEYLFMIWPTRHKKVVFVVIYIARALQRNKQRFQGTTHWSIVLTEAG